ncbi:hypothetical protein HPP92_012479 [Vanilla planifolia]|uniref:Uncharacterized protein n=1 Tax=Vanilla planifolia TaxID=51239 RepID=A0A835R2P0_VANPL|nr:hypothetical protein HPP92_012479 [Vanilla planifolia]
MVSAVASPPASRGDGAWNKPGPYLSASVEGDMVENPPCQIMAHHYGSPMGLLAVGPGQPFAPMLGLCPPLDRCSPLCHRGQT